MPAKPVGIYTFYLRKAELARLAPKRLDGLADEDRHRKPARGAGDR